MRYLIFSDTHGVREPMKELYQRYPYDGIVESEEGIVKGVLMQYHG